MKNNIIWICLLTISLHTACNQQSRYVEYLSDSIPGEIPVQLNLPVGDGLFVAERIALSKNGKDLYFSERNGYNADSEANIIRINYSGRKWGKPEVVFKDSCGAAALSPDGKSLFFQYDHPTHPKGLVSHKTSSGWSEPVSFSKNIRGSHYLQSVKSGSYYFSEIAVDPGAKRDIYRASDLSENKIIDTLGFGEVATIGGDFFIAADESYIILLMDRNENQGEYTFYQKLDFFISFKQPDGLWSLPKNMGEAINGALYSWKWGQYVSTDNKYFFFTSWENGQNEAVYLMKFDQILKDLYVNR